MFHILFWRGPKHQEVVLTARSGHLGPALLTSEAEHTGRLLQPVTGDSSHQTSFRVSGPGADAHAVVFRNVLD